jgi:hypothetical protein
MTVALLSEIFISVYMTLIMTILKIVKNYHHGCFPGGVYYTIRYISFNMLTPTLIHSNNYDQALPQNSLQISEA